MFPKLNNLLFVFSIIFIVAAAQQEQGSPSNSDSSVSYLDTATLTPGSLTGPTPIPAALITPVAGSSMASTKPTTTTTTAIAGRQQHTSNSAAIPGDTTIVNNADTSSGTDVHTGGVLGLASSSNALNSSLKMPIPIGASTTASLSVPTTTSTGEGVTGGLMSMAAPTGAAVRVGGQGTNVGAGIVGGIAALLGWIL